jgi:hypothetical protein
VQGARAHVLVQLCLLFRFVNNGLVSEPAASNANKFQTALHWRMHDFSYLLYELVF